MQYPIVLDLETVGLDPFNKDGRVVSAHLYNEVDGAQSIILDSDTIEPTKNAINELQRHIDNCTVLVNHNIKYDILWLLAIGIRVPRTIWCTQVGQYLLNEGEKEDLDLDAVAAGYGVDGKAGSSKELIAEYGSMAMVPASKLIPYGEQDAKATYDVYLEQLKLMEEKGGKTFTYAQQQMRLCRTLADIEFNGLKIDQDKLAAVDDMLTKGIDESSLYINTRLPEIVGDVEVNFDSPEQLSKLVFSREIEDKEAWKTAFGFFPKQKAPHRAMMLSQYPKSKFIYTVKRLTTVTKKKQRQVCSSCVGCGKVKSDTSNRMINCKVCKGKGVELVDTEHTAGLRAIPRKEWVVTSGFGTKETILDEAMETVKGENARTFLQHLIRIKKWSSYKRTFVEGVYKNVASNWIIHPQLNQTVTATGRLSSSDPNFQNLARSPEVPLRSIVVSRWDGGKILDADWAQLEFRVAAILSGDENAIRDINNGFDIHKFSAAWANNCTEEEITSDQRTAAKAISFKPLYGGGGEYKEVFYMRYPRIRVWHDDLARSVIKDKQIVLPSGRVYHFEPKFSQAGNLMGTTKIKNYPVQGFASADVVLLMLTIVHEALMPYKSKVINTIHDSIVVDVHPEELDIVPKVVYDILKMTNRYVEQAYDMPTLPVDLATEMKMGDNLGELYKLKMR